MIAYVEGRLAQQWGNSCIVMTEGGIGYAISLPNHTLSHLPERGEPAAFYTSFQVREDAQELYGFETWDERQTFEILISISKVGARTALAILSLYRPDDLRRLVFEDDMVALTRVSGIGKKSAQHIFLELKYKLKVEEIPPALAGATPVGNVFRDVLDGLHNLGYAEEETLPIVKNILQQEPDLDVSSALRSALKSLAMLRQ